jgi:hypothetical protein
MSVFSIIAQVAQLNFYTRVHCVVSMRVGTMVREWGRVRELPAGAWCEALLTRVGSCARAVDGFYARVHYVVSTRVGTMVREWGRVRELPAGAWCEALLTRVGSRARASTRGCTA